MNGILHPSQETTESTELHPATTFERLNLEPLNPENRNPTLEP